MVDTLHSDQGMNSNIYYQFVLQKANALLMDENSMDFFFQQLNISPEIITNAILYVKAIIRIFKEHIQLVPKERKEMKNMLHKLD